MIYNNEKFKTHIEGLDMLLFGGLCLHKSCTEHTLKVVIQGEEGTLYTVTDVRGIEVEDSVETRKDPLKGSDLHISSFCN